jgi:hypothetical protein
MGARFFLAILSSFIQKTLADLKGCPNSNCVAPLRIGTFEQSNPFISYCYRRICNFTFTISIFSVKPAVATLRIS